jgi:hypothetical protein
VTAGAPRSGRLPAGVAIGLIALLVVGWVRGLSNPHDLIGTVGWSFTVLATFYGLGMALQRCTRISLLFGEAVLIGAGLWVAIIGVLLPFGVASRLPQLALAALGSLCAGYEIVTSIKSPAASPSSTGADERVGWDRTALVLLVLLGGYLLLNLAGSISTRGNPFDDSVAYGGFVRRLLNCGDLTEPFSFRRLSAYGGQTALLALGALRGDYESFDLVDRGLFQPVAALVLLDLARRRRLHVAAAALLVTFVVAQMENRFNSAAHWTGIAFFLGIYHFASREDLSPRASLWLVAALAGVACTLRQNYILPAGMFVLASLIFHLRAQRRAAGDGSWAQVWREERRIVLLAVAIAGVVVLPYMIAAWQSNRTFLYPVLLGTGNPVAPLRPIGATIFDELSFFVAVFLNSEPVRPWWMLAPLLFMARDPRARKPFTALLWSSAIGFVYLTHSFTLSDAYNIWRYAAGYMTPLLAVFMAELLVELPLVEPRGERMRLKVSPLVSAMVLFTLLLQAVESRTVVSTRVKEDFIEAKAAFVNGSVRTGAREELYRQMQAAIPAGGTVAALVDESFHLDFGRNRIVNLDLPGFAAPAPGLPSFLAVEDWRTYLHSQGIRYVVYIDGDYSTYLFRRPIWSGATFSDHGIWRYMATHMVDIIDAFRGLTASSRVLFQRDGFVAIDLGPVTAVDPEALRARYRVPELLREQTWLQRQLAAELHPGLWNLMTRYDVVFDDVLPIDFTPPENSVWSAFGLAKAVAIPPRRWLSDRTHIRVHGERRQRLQLELYIDNRKLGTRPTVAVSIDGQQLFASAPIADGKVSIDATTACRGWCDVYVSVSSVGVTWQAASTVRGIRLDSLTWTELSGR